MGPLTTIPPSGLITPSFIFFALPTKEYIVAIPAIAKGIPKGPKGANAVNIDPTALIKPDIANPPITVAKAATPSLELAIKPTKDAKPSKIGANISPISPNIPCIFSNVFANASEADIAFNCWTDCSLLLATASANNWALFSSVTSELANWSAVIPTDLAIASCCKTFIWEKSLKSPTLAAISAVSVS